MSEPRRHHFVPRFSLAHFADNDGNVWTYDAEADAPRPSTPLETGHERDFHTVTRENGERDTAIEKMLSDLEGAAAPIYADMTKGVLPKGEARDLMVEFFAIAHVRSKRMRRSYGESYGQMMQIFLQHTAERPDAFETAFRHMEEDEGVTFTDAERERFRKEMADMSGYRLSIDREWTLQAFAMAGAIAPLIDAMHWSLVETRDEIFVLSDSPLVKAGRGFGTEETQATLPLSPNMMWMGHWRDDFPPRIKLTRGEARNFNRMRAMNADRFLYAPFADDGLMRFCKKHVKPRPAFKIDGGDLSKTAPVSVRRKLD